MQKTDCIFCKIAQEIIPAYRLWESDACLAFLDMGPLARGHTLLIPKQHFKDILDIPLDILTSLVEPIPKLAAAIMRATDATGLNVLQNTGQSSGQAVFHLHFHFIPRVEGDGLGYRWNAGKYEEGLAETIQSSIKQQLVR